MGSITGEKLFIRTFGTAEPSHARILEDTQQYLTYVERTLVDPSRLVRPVTPMYATGVRLTSIAKTDRNKRQKGVPRNMDLDLDRFWAVRMGGSGDKYQVQDTPAGPQLCTRSHRRSRPAQDPDLMYPGVTYHKGFGGAKCYPSDCFAQALLERDYAVAHRVIDNPDFPIELAA